MWAKRPPRGGGAGGSGRGKPRGRGGNSGRVIVDTASELDYVGQSNVSAPLQGPGMEESFEVCIMGLLDI